MLCEYNCGKTASYDFVDKKGHWRFGCIGHWVEFRASKQLGPGHGRALTPDIEPEPRPEGHPELDPKELVKPRIAPYLRDRLKPVEPTKAAKIRDVHAAKQRRINEFSDMEPTSEEVKSVKPGSVLYVTLELCRTQNGATLEEIQAAIGGGHNALKLLEWANENKGMGWKIDPETKKISPIYYGKSSDT